jgi:hypothetical protein
MEFKLGKPASARTRSRRQSATAPLAPTWLNDTSSTSHVPLKASAAAARNTSSGPSLRRDHLAPPTPRSSPTY